MATVIWRGDAAAVAQVERYSVSGVGAPTVGESITFTCGNKTIVVEVTNSNNASAAAFYGSCVTAIGTYDNDIPEFAEVTATSDSTYLYLTGPVSGKPFTITATSSGGGLSVSQSTTTTASSPNDVGLAANWVGGSLPANGDTVIIENTDSSLLYNLDDLASVALASLQIRQSFTGEIGLPAFGADYYEYRTTKWQIASSSVVIGQGSGTGSGRIQLDLRSTQTEVIVWNTGTPDDPDIGAVSIIGSNASNVVRVAKGSVGIATALASDTATVATLEMAFDTNQDSDSSVTVGSGVTLTTIKVYGGEHEIRADFTNLTQYGGRTRLMTGVSPSGAIDILGGQCLYDSDGTLTQGYVAAGGELIFGKFDARTVTNLSIYAGATVRDPFDTVTWSNGIILVRCSIEDVTLDLGTGITLTPS